MKKTFMIVLAFLLAQPMARAQITGDAPQAEKWKGESPTYEFNVGALAGLGVIGLAPGFTLLGTAAKKIVNRGFVGGEINDQVFLELEIGPHLYSGSWSLMSSLHLRWDFVFDTSWTFFALGGLSANFTSDVFNNTWPLFPRVGVGAFWHAHPMFSIRGEVSHEAIVGGVALYL